MINPVSSAVMANSVTSIYNYGLRYSPTVSRRAMPEAPVTPVRPSPAVSIHEPSRAEMAAPLWRSAYSAEQAARSRVRYVEPFPLTDRQTAGSQKLADGFARLDWENLPADPAELAVRMRIQYPGDEALELPGSRDLPGADQLLGAEKDDAEAELGAEGAQAAAEEGRCQTCEERKYQDGSDDSSVSYQTPTRIDPDAAQAAVRSHELEHVSHEQAKAQREGRKVVSQTVTLHTDICPECGRVYVSGGTTRTVTKEISQPEEAESGEAEK